MHIFAYFWIALMIMIMVLKCAGMKVLRRTNRNARRSTTSTSKWTTRYAIRWSRSWRRRKRSRWPRSARSTRASTSWSSRPTSCGWVASSSWPSRTTRRTSSTSGSSRSPTISSKCSTWTDVPRRSGAPTSTRSHGSTRPSRATSTTRSRKSALNSSKCSAFDPSRRPRLPYIVLFYYSIHACVYTVYISVDINSSSQTERFFYLAFFCSH